MLRGKGISRRNRYRKSIIIKKGKDRNTEEHYTKRGSWNRQVKPSA